MQSQTSLTGKQYGLSALAGLLAALLMFVVIQFGISAGIAPFKIPPSGAFLIKLGIPAVPFGIFLHFVYGAFWSLVLITLYRDRVNLTKGLAVALILWLIFMLIYSPIIGWGLFGSGGTSMLPDVLHLGSTMKFVVITFVLHVIYGLIIGWGNSSWISFD